MFSSALKSFSSNISSNYTIAPQPTSTSGPWKIFDAKKKSTGKAASVFMFDKKSLEPNSASLGGRGSTSGLRKVHEEVLDRLRREASSLARLRHPNILELAEPIEDTRNGGLMFATEPVQASLQELLHDQDRGSRSKQVELDELEIQKGLLQVSKGLEFIHDSAELVHGNLTPEAIFVNAKSDWKISGLGFAGGPNTGNTTKGNAPISLHQALHYDHRLPRSVQLNLDYSSPDFVMDSNVTAYADMFSLGLLIIALYNSPHHSPLETNSSVSTYKRLFSSSASVPNANNNFLSAKPLPKSLLGDALPKLITRRPAGRFSAREFQESRFFDNILVSTIRFLDSLPAKTPNEKVQFLRGLPKILPQFPDSVMERKLLPALLDEMKDRELIALILQNMIAITKRLKSGKQAFCDKVIPALETVFLTGPKGTGERDSAKEAGLMILLENMKTVAENCSGREFKAVILPIIYLALDSPTHAIVDSGLKTLSIALSVLDFSTIKNELFPVIAQVFSKTNSLGIKIRGLEAFKVLCGGKDGEDEQYLGDDLDGIVVEKKTGQSSVVLDKYTIQEKVVPLMKAIKTKEPAVMMAALDVFKQVGRIADSDYLALEVLPVLWTFSLGPLLNLEQFSKFMALIKSLSGRIEREHSRRIQELTATNGTTSTRAKDFTSFGTVPTPNGTSTEDLDDDFEALVLGRKTARDTANNMLDGDWNTTAPTRPSIPASKSSQQTPQSSSFAWSQPTSSDSAPPSAISAWATSPTTTRAVTPDASLSTFASLTPSSPFNNPLQPSRPSNNLASQISPPPLPQQHATGSTIDWSTASKATANPWIASPPGTAGLSNAPMSGLSPQTGGGIAAMASNSKSGSSIASPPPSQSSQFASFSIAPPPGRPSIGQTQTQSQTQSQTQINSTFGNGVGLGRMQQPQQPLQGAGGGSGGGQKQGLDKYESLL
ncbi:hypothetical protein EV356DRAFT_449795 [Viridothelium virens]|uniref:Protein kinase domain-containing protein n=1 Tax=Viridothelium virens TaxID=1048519 RepID=A0A6A6H4R7_VIRVR|nr:hypothetical protein EV356DRAFT_449795 [Viridothelium virens]